MAAYPATQPRQKCRSIQRRGPPIQIRLLANLGIESRTLMFHLVKSPQDQSGLSAVWRKKKRKNSSLSAHAEANPRQGVYTSDAKMYAAEEDDRAEGWETGRPAARCIGQECRCHGNQQPRVGIWSGRWSYCRGFRARHTSGRSAHMALSSLLAIPFISDSSDPAAL